MTRTASNPNETTNLKNHTKHLIIWPTDSQAYLPDYGTLCPKTNPIIFDIPGQTKILFSSDLTDVRGFACEDSQV